MSLEKEIEEFDAVIEPLFDNEKADKLTTFDLTSIQANLIGNINSIGMKEMEEATKARKAVIEKEMKSGRIVCSCLHHKTSS